MNPSIERRRMMDKDLKRAVQLRERLVKLALDWQAHLGVAPSVTSAISELDAAILLSGGVSCLDKGRSAVTKGVDFVFKKTRYQVKANRPSGREGSKPTKVSKPREINWDALVWICYTETYEPLEAYAIEAAVYAEKLHNEKYLRPDAIMALKKCEMDLAPLRKLLSCTGNA